MKYQYLLLLTVVFCFSTRAQSLQQTLDSLNTELGNSGSDSNRVKILNNLSFYNRQSQPERGVELGKEALELANKINWPKGKAQALAMVGINYEALGNYELALEFETKSLQLNRSLGRRSSEASMLANISLIYLHQSDYSQALKYALQSKSLQENIGNRKNLAIVNENIGVIFFRLKNYEKTREYYQKASEIYAELDEPISLARSKANLGLLYYDLGDYEKAEQYYLESLATNKKLGVKQSLLINYMNLGNVKSKLGNYDEALTYYQDALELSEELNNKRTTATTFGNIGDLYLEMARPMPEQSKERRARLAQASDYLERSIAMCRELNFYDPMIEYYRSLSEVSNLQNDFETALSHFKSYTEIRDSIRSAEKGQELSLMESRHELEIRDKNITLKDNQIQIQKLALSKQRSELALYVAGLIVLILLLVIILRKWLYTSQSNRELSEKNKAQLALIESQLKDIKARSKILNEIAYMQAHDVRGPLSTILGLVQLINHKDPGDPFNKFVLENLETVTKELDQAVREVIQKKEELP